MSLISTLPGPLGTVPPRKLRAAGVRSASELAKELPERLLPVRAELTSLLPFGGLRKGSTLAVLGSTSLTLALLAEATARGSWAAIVGRPELGVLAAAELGVELSRLALIPDPGSDPLATIDALFDGLDLIVFSSKNRTLSGPKNASMARKMSARARQRGTVLLVDEQIQGADPVLRCLGREWLGPDQGHDILSGQRILVERSGHGPRERISVTLPSTEYSRLDPSELDAARAV